MNGKLGYKSRLVFNTKERAVKPEKLTLTYVELVSTDCYGRLEKSILRNAIMHRDWIGLDAQLRCWSACILSWVKVAPCQRPYQCYYHCHPTFRFTRFDSKPKERT